jgi:hypothetical protein
VARGVTERQLSAVVRNQKSIDNSITARAIDRNAISQSIPQIDFTGLSIGSTATDEEFAARREPHAINPALVRIEEYVW